MPNPKVSVIMGIYNCEATLSEAIDSIIAQTWQDWELIMCDDGSKDHTFSVAESYLKLYPEKIILLKNEKNCGLNYTLNHCLEHVHGEYVARMDGDDLSTPDRFEKEVAYLDAHPEDALVSCRMTLFDENGDWGMTSVIEHPTKENFCSGEALFCHAPCMVRAEAYRKVKGYTVSPRLLRVEDRHLWFKLYAAGYQGANLNEALYKMRDDRNAVSRRTWSNRKNAVYVLWLGFRMLKLPWYRYIFAIKYTLREMIICLMPNGVYSRLHRAKQRNS